MVDIDVVLIADVFHYFSIRPQVHRLSDCPRLCIDLGVIDRDLQIHMPKVFPAKVLDDVKSIRRWLARLIHPRLSIEPFTVDYQSVAIPLRCGITPPCGNEIVCQLTAIEEDLPPCVRGLVENHDGSGRLDDLPRGWSGSHP